MPERIHIAVLLAIALAAMTGGCQQQRSYDAAVLAGETYRGDSAYVVMDRPLIAAAKRDYRAVNAAPRWWESREDARLAPREPLRNEAVLEDLVITRDTTRVTGDRVSDTYRQRRYSVQGGYRALPYGRRGRY